ncbi:MAG: hypothetical protein K2L51_03995, partial [Clostridiales bacterium]|nr:hypothetical protein [Clostridiales bacterium]
SNAGGTVSGILDLATYGANKESYKLDEYEEYAGNKTPASPFGDDKHEGTNRKVLMVNIPDDGSDGTVYGYTSQSVTFTGNRFYRVSAWVRTGKNGGAAIRLTGMDKNVAISDINTYTADPKENNNYNWEEFVFYIASSSYADQTVNISLQMGDSYSDDDVRLYKPSTGYALFDNVQVQEIAPATFYRTESEQQTAGTKNIAVYNFADKTSVPFSKTVDLNFADEKTGWDSIHPEDADIFLYNSGTLEFQDDNDYGFTSDPLSSLGKIQSQEAGSAESSVLVISSLHNNTSAGVSTPAFTVKRYHYYRIAAWVKTQDVTDGDGATLALFGMRDNTVGDTPYSGRNFLATVTSCSGDDSNTARGGYRQYSIYVKGSVLRDYTASVECRLGADSNKSRGIAFFDNVTVEEISPADYNSYNANGNLTVDFDTQAPIDTTATTVSFPDTGITNGEFYQVGEYDYDANEFLYPVVPAGWTQYTPDTAGTQGYSTTAVETDGIIAGIIPTDDATFNDCVQNGWLGNGAYNHVHKDGSILMLSSSKPTAFAYRSSAFTAAADTPGTLTVSLLAENMNATDYGASLVLKDGDRILATIEGIKNTNVFKTYTFYVEPSSTEITTLSIEIWLGNSDRENNKSKLSSGYVYVQRVAYAAIEDDTETDSAGNSTVTKSKSAKFAEFKTACEAERKSGLPIARAAYSFKSVDLTAYDVYDDSFIKYPYDWTLTASGAYANSVQYGVFDPNNRPASSYPFVPESFENSPQSTADGILMLNNKLPAASTLSYNGSLAIAADTYYRVEVSVRVDFPEQERANAKGATIALVDSDGNKKTAHSDIRETVTKPDSIVTDTFRTYAFYIKSGSEATTVSLSLSLGESDYSKQTAGRVYVNSVTCTDVNNTIYDQAVEEIAKREKGKSFDETFRYARIADLSVTGEETDETPSEKGCGTLDWWLIPSILFAVAILIALIGFVVRKIMEKKASKKGVVEKRVSYDRAATLNVEHNKNAAEEEKVNSVSEDGNDSHYETFNDDETVAKPQAAAKPEATTDAENTATEADKQEPTENAEAVTEPTETESAPSEKDETVATESAAQNEDSPAPQTEFIDRFDD